MNAARYHFTALLAFGGLCASSPQLLQAQQSAAPAWIVTVTPTLNPLPVGSCGAVHVKVLDPSGREAPRDPLGRLVTAAAFDMTVSTSLKGAVVGQWLDDSNWVVCACQGTAVGTQATVTAKYPGKLLTAKSKVAANTKPLQIYASVKVAAAKGASNPPACTLVNAVERPQESAGISAMPPAPAARDPFAAAVTPARPVTTAPAVVGSSAKPLTMTSFIGHGEIGPAGGVVESTDRRLTLRFPAGALSAATDIKIENLSTDVDSPARGWRLSPDGLNFKVPVEMLISYSDSDVTGSVPEALEIGSRSTGGKWNMLDQFALDAKAKTLTAKIEHFSDWSLLQGLQLRPADPMVMVGESVNLVVNSCELIDQESDLVLLRAKCEPEDLVLRTADWAVNEHPGGNATVGTVGGKETGTGTYTAPEKKPKQPRVDVSTVYTSPPKGRRGELKGLLVSNVTVVDAKGWRGWVKYTMSGTQKSDETKLLSTVTTNTQIENFIVSSGALTLAPYFGAIPGSMIVVTGTGEFSRSSVQRIVNTGVEPDCTWVTKQLDDERETGKTSDPSNTLTIVVLSIAGTGYQLKFRTLAGQFPMTKRVGISGQTTRQGTGAQCPGPTNVDNTLARVGTPNAHELVLDGVVDPSNPNLIRGQKTNDIEDLQGGPWSKIPGKVEVIWQLER